MNYRLCVGLCVAACVFTWLARLDCMSPGTCVNLRHCIYVYVGMCPYASMCDPEKGPCARGCCARADKKVYIKTLSLANLIVQAVMAFVAAITTLWTVGAHARVYVCGSVHKRAGRSSPRPADPPAAGSPWPWPFPACGMKMKCKG